MKNIKITLSLIAFGFLSSCVNDTFEDPKAKDCISSGLVKNKEVADIYAIAINPTGVPIPNTPTYPTDDIIEGYVVSSDEGGNFYQNMYVQPIGGGKGYNLSVDEGNVYNKGYEPGKKVFLKMKGLGYGNPTSFAAGLIFGAPPTDKYTVDRLPALDFPKHLIPSCDAVVSEDAIVNHITLAQAKVANNPYLNTLVEFDNVQFETEGISYDTDRSDLFDSSINIEDGSTSFVVRTSRYAGFAGNIVPSGKGKIRGVLTKYNTTYQIILRTERDVKLTAPRADYSPPIVGNANVFTGTLNEPFTSYTITNQTNFPKYINDANVSSRYWQLKTFSGNKYIEMSSFGGGGVTAKTYFLVPVDFTAANTFTFKKLARFYAGSTPLQVYYVKGADYAPGSVINLSAFTNITPSFTISYPAIGASETVFGSVGTYAIPASLTGNGYFVFEYSGTPTLTTTIQIDDIVIN